MQELWPIPTDDLDIGARLASDERPQADGRPWVTLVMITTLDGAVAVDGLSGGLGNESDSKRFLAARHHADGIIVGARTATEEDYQPTVTPIVVMSGSLSLDPSARLFGDPTRQPVIFTTNQAARSRGTDFDGIAEIVALGDSLDPVGVLADLDNRGMASVVLEGGPTLNSHFLRADLVDEILLSYSPLVVGGDAKRLVHGPLMPAELRFAVDRVLLADDLIFVRYVRQR